VRVGSDGAGEEEGNPKKWEKSRGEKKGKKRLYNRRSTNADVTIEKVQPKGYIARKPAPKFVKRGTGVGNLNKSKEGEEGGKPQDMSGGKKKGS